MKHRKTKFIGHFLHGTCFLQHVTEGRVEGKRRGCRRYKQLFDDLRKREETGVLKRKH
jgi:hypothetical protein